MTPKNLEDAEEFLLGKARLLEGTLDAAHLGNWLTYGFRELRKQEEAALREGSK